MLRIIFGSSAVLLAGMRFQTFLSLPWREPLSPIIVVTLALMGIGLLNNRKWAWVVFVGLFAVSMATYLLLAFTCEIPPRVLLNFAMAMVWWGLGGWIWNREQKIQASDISTLAVAQRPAQHSPFLRGSS